MTIKRYQLTCVYVLKVLCIVSWFITKTGLAQNSSNATGCYADTSALSDNNPNLNDTKPVIFCNIQDLSKSTSCTIDGASLSGDYQNACNSSSGLFDQQNVTLTCTAIYNGITYPANFHYLNYPVCFAATCSQSDMNDYYNSTVYTFLVQSTASQGFDSFTCEPYDNSAAIPTPGLPPTPAPVPTPGESKPPPTSKPQSASPPTSASSTNIVTSNARMSMIGAFSVMLSLFIGIDLYN